MSISDEDIDDLVDKVVREILAEREDGERSNVAVKARELGIYKDRIHRRLKGVGPRTIWKPVNYKLSVIQEVSLLRYILSLDEIGHSVRYNQISNVTNVILVKDYTITVPASSRVDPGIKLGPSQNTIFSFSTITFDSYGIHQKRSNWGRNGYIR